MTVATAPFPIGLEAGADTLLGDCDASCELGMLGSEIGLSSPPAGLGDSGLGDKLLSCSATPNVLQGRLGRHLGVR
jgi:hypothetical protein